MKGRLATTWEAPKWCKVESFVRDQAMLLGLECKVEVEKGWIRERGRVEVKGEEDKCHEFNRRFIAAMDAYNNA